MTSWIVFFCFDLIRVLEIWSRAKLYCCASYVVTYDAGNQGVKVLQKNILSRILAGQDDSKPQVVILNVKSSMRSLFLPALQNSQSINTRITLITVDILQAVISLIDLYRMINDVKRTLYKLGISSNALISTAEKVLKHYPVNRRPTTISRESQTWALNSTAHFARISLKQKQVLPTMNLKVEEYDIPIPISKSLSLRDASRVSSAQSTSPISSGRPTTALNRLSSQEHYRLLKKALQVLFLTEFMLLIEFTEVLVPVIYSGFLTILYHLSNRRFYPQLANLTDEELWARVTSVLEYGVLELVSLVVLIVVLNHLVHRHSLKQLAFVLEREFLMVQPKLILWVVMTMQSTLPQLGVDYSFKFAWLRNKDNITDT